ncbi:glycoside hydrolase family 3 N-terminal domain-containing protein [Demequina capsici]|uniref:beta-N-acetylhexosaminidase n=1 Tax=Demequina capsici TaxID=3075620 RepID=A0AA96F595_9MICO|nr:glycoside hydrolase family 3 N-terminal domain-containing protein [Demequina sp. OYTSA14]WNM24009.1 glycoside hydrolase family 3 N-terminal domain-containing protein [Demequina sp. OYTSA14]
MRRFLAGSLRTTAVALSVGVLAACGASPTQPTASAPPTPSSTSALASASPDPGHETFAWGPTLAAWDDALATAQGLSAREAAGAVLMPSYTYEDPAELERMVADQGLAGVMLLASATESAGVAADLNAAAQEGAAGRGWPALLSVDQEGGTVARLSDGVADLPAFMAAGAARDKSLVRGVYAAQGRDLAQLGFTVDFAPVADVTIGLADPVIRSRSAGDDPDAVADTVVAAMRGYLDAGVIPTIKHFPGHGSVTVDSHDALPTQSASLDVLQQADLVPFTRAIDAGAPMVMMSHIAVAAWGDEPASLDPQAYAYLRDQLGFTGVAITDALNMGAITESYGPGEASVKALAAGADLLLMPESVDDSLNAIVAAVDAGTLPRARLDEAAARVILLSRWQAGLVQVAPTVTGDYARALADAGVTVAAADCDAPFVTGPVTITGGFRADRDALAAALASHGVVLGEGGSTIWLTGSDDTSGSADVVVAMDGPWGLSGSTARVYAAVYGRGDSALAGLADVLTGAVAPQGRWPVALANVPAAC